MNRILLITLSLLGLLLFNSCKDEEPEDKDVPVKIIHKLKSLVGISSEDAKKTIISWGYTYLTSEDYGQNITMHSFESKPPSSSYLLYEKNNVIYLCQYNENNNKSNALERFEQFSGQSIDYMYNKIYTYEGLCKDNDYQTTEYQTHQAFKNYYLPSKTELQSCSETWERIEEAITTQYKANYESYKTYISYTDKLLAPTGGNQK